MKIGLLLQELAQVAPQGRGIVFEDQSFSWREMNERVNRLANGLAAMGLTKGDKVAILAQNSHRFVETWIALSKGGFVAVALNSESAPPEVAFILEDSGAKALLADEQYIERIGQTALPPAVSRLICFNAKAEGWKNYEELLAASSPQEPVTDVAPEDVRALLYTSGTTGNPKGCVNTHGQWHSSFKNFVEEIEPPRNEAMLLVVPLFVGYGSSFILSALLTQNTMIVLQRFRPDAVLDAIERHKVAVAGFVPTMLIGMMNEPDFARRDLSSLKLIVYGGSVIAPAVLKTALEKFKSGFCQVFGMTEAGGFIAFLNQDDHRVDGSERMEARLKSCGRSARYAKITIVDDDGNEVPPNELGELTVRSSSTVTGYWNKPAETAAAIRNGALYTGDVAYKDADGYIFITDRKKEMIVSGGMNIYPAEIEAVIYRHPAVAQVAVIGVPDDKWGEAVKAVVELKPGIAATADELMEFCAPHLAKQKRPKSFDFWKSLPTGVSGKLAKKEIRDVYWKGHERKI